MKQHSHPPKWVQYLKTHPDPESKQKPKSAHTGAYARYQEMLEAYAAGATGGPIGHKPAPSSGVALKPAEDSPRQYVRVQAAVRRRSRKGKR